MFIKKFLSYTSIAYLILINFLSILFSKYTVTKINEESEKLQVLKDNKQILNQFLSAKEIEGCSGKRNTL